MDSRPAGGTHAGTEHVAQECSLLPQLGVLCVCVCVLSNHALQSQDPTDQTPLAILANHLYSENMTHIRTKIQHMGFLMLMHGADINTLAVSRTAVTHKWRCSHRHDQMDGSTERFDQIIEEYLRENEWYGASHTAHALRTARWRPLPHWM